MHSAQKKKTLLSCTKRWCSLLTFQKRGMVYILQEKILVFFKEERLENILSTKDTLPISIMLVLPWAICHRKKTPNRRSQDQLLCTQRLSLCQPTVHPYGYLVHIRKENLKLLMALAEHNIIRWIEAVLVCLCPYM